MNLRESSSHTFNAPPAGEIFDILKRDCREWITEASWLPVYRGGKSANQYDDFIIGKVRPDKQDPDIPPTIQESFDQSLEKKGFEAVVKNSLHVIGDPEEAATYGRLFVIFPIGPFSFTWSPKVLSLMGALYRSGEKIANLKNIIPTYQNENLKMAIRSGNEILIKCREYYKVDADLWRQISN